MCSSCLGTEFVQASQARPLLSLLIQQTGTGEVDPHTGSIPLYVVSSLSSSVTNVFYTM